MKKKTAKALKRLIISLLFIIIILSLLYFGLSQAGLTDLEREDVQKFVGSTGALAPLIFVLVSFLQVTFIPIPSTVTVLAGSYLFGAVGSFLLSYTGIILGSLFAFFLGRRLGRPFAIWVAGDEETLDGWIAKLHAREHALLWIIFFAPFFPDDLISTVAGLFKISYPEFILMQLVTRATTIGATLIFASGEVIPLSGVWLWVLGVIFVLFIVLSVLVLIYYERLADRLTALFKRKK